MVETGQRGIASAELRNERLLNYLVGGGQQRFRDGDAKRLGRLEVDDELEPGWLHDRQVGGLDAIENAAGIDADLTIHVREVRSIAHQPAGSHSITIRINRRNTFARRQGDNLYAAADEEYFGSHEEGIGAVARKGGKGCIDLADRRSIEDMDLQPDGAGSFLHLPQSGLGCRSVGRIDEHRNTNRLGHQLMQESQPLEKWRP
jgi:hypothetical protein